MNKVNGLSERNHSSMLFTAWIKACLENCRIKLIEVKIKISSKCCVTQEANHDEQEDEAIRSQQLGTIHEAITP